MKDMKGIKDTFMKKMGEVKDQAASFVNQHQQGAQQTENQSQQTTQKQPEVPKAKTAGTDIPNVLDTQGGEMPDVDQVNQDIQKAEQNYNKKAA